MSDILDNFHNGQFFVSKKTINSPKKIQLLILNGLGDEEIILYYLNNNHFLNTDTIFEPFVSTKQFSVVLARKNKKTEFEVKLIDKQYHLFLNNKQVYISKLNINEIILDMNYYAIQHDGLTYDIVDLNFANDFNLKNYPHLFLKSIKNIDNQSEDVDEQSEDVNEQSKEVDEQSEELKEFIEVSKLEENHQAEKVENVEHEQQEEKEQHEEEVIEHEQHEEVEQVDDEQQKEEEVIEHEQQEENEQHEEEVIENEQHEEVEQVDNEQQEEYKQHEEEVIEHEQKEENEQNEEVEQVYEEEVIEQEQQEKHEQVDNEQNEEEDKQHEEVEVHEQIEEKEQIEEVYVNEKELKEENQELKGNKVNVETEKIVSNETPQKTLKQMTFNEFYLEESESNVKNNIDQIENKDNIISENKVLRWKDQELKNDKESKAKEVAETLYKIENERRDLEKIRNQRKEEREEKESKQMIKIIEDFNKFNTISPELQNEEEKRRIENKFVESQQKKNIIYAIEFHHMNRSYRIPCIRLEESNIINFQNIFLNPISPSNTILKHNIAIEVQGNNTYYLIHFLNTKYLIYKVQNNLLIVTNIQNKNTKMIKNKEIFKLNGYDYLLTNHCSLLVPMENKKYFDNNYGTTFNTLIPRFA